MNNEIGWVKFVDVTIEINQESKKFSLVETNYSSGIQEAYHWVD